MPTQFEDSDKSAQSSDTKLILDKLDEVVQRLENYHKHDVEFQQKLLLLLSKMLGNQEISMEAFDKLDVFLRKEYFWEK